MTQHDCSSRFGGSVADNYQRYFVPAIGAPVADDLVAVADLRPGERVLDVACGTGVVSRRAARCVGGGGRVVGLDINPGMLAVARSATTTGLSIDWSEASAESMPFPDAAFDVVLCQMGLQFIPNKLAALREMRRVLAHGGRAHLSVPGPRPPIFGVMSEGLARHVSPAASAFAEMVFSLHDVDELAALMRSAGFGDIDVQATTKALRLPGPEDFLWQYIHSTPIAELAARAGQREREALTRDVCRQWRESLEDGCLSLEVGMTTVSARK